MKQHPAHPQLLELYQKALLAWDGNADLREFAAAMQVGRQQYCDMNVLIRFRWENSILNLRDLCDEVYLEAIGL